MFSFASKNSQWISFFVFVSNVEVVVYTVWNLISNCVCIAKFRTYNWAFIIMLQFLSRLVIVILKVSLLGKKNDIKDRQGLSFSSTVFKTKALCIKSSIVFLRYFKAL